MGTKSDIIRHMISRGMTTREICDATGFSESLVATIRWKGNNLDRWRETHRNQARRRYYETKGPRRLADIKSHSAWVVAAYKHGMSKLDIARHLGCSKAGVESLIKRQSVE